MKAENRHYDKVHKKKAHPAAKCGNKKCLICHSGKVMKIPTRKILQENSKLKNSEMTECYFTPKKDTTSATICANCGLEKMLHTIGEGVNVNKVIIISDSEFGEEYEEKQREADDIVNEMNDW